MIVTEPTSQSPLKPQMSRPGPQTATLPQSPPPYAPPYAPAAIQPYSAVRRPSPARRFFRAFGIAVGIYYLGAMLISSIFWSVQHGIHHRRGRDQTPWPKDDDAKGWPVPSDGSAEHCVGGRDWTPYTGFSSHPYSAHVTFDLPVSSDVLYLFARGSLADGSVAIMHSEDASRDTVQVDVIVNYHNQIALDRANVCSLQRNPRQNGVGIFTPNFWKHHSKKDLLQFDIKVYLPVRHTQLLINAFETDLPLFFHDIGDLANTVVFERLSLRGSNQPISVGSLYANHASITNSNSPITGSFNSSTFLELRTSNSFISANVGLINDPSGNATELVMTTSNGLIHSSISLSSSQSTGGSFNVSTKTSNGALSVIYDASPLASILRHEARTSNALATVDLHSAYEGSFNLQSSNASPFISKKHATDPSGQGRRRIVKMFRARGLVTGEVHWGREMQLRGANVEIRTSNSPAHLSV